MSDDAIGDPRQDPCKPSARKSQKGLWEFVNLKNKTEAFYEPDSLGYEDGEAVGVRLPFAEPQPKGAPQDFMAGGPLAERDVVVPGDRRDERLYRIPDCESVVGGIRYVLVYWDDRSLGGARIPPVNRELCPDDASLWYELNLKAPPPPLIPVPIRDPSKDPTSRLNRDWLPPSAPPAEPAGPPLILGEPGDEPVVRGKKKPRLTAAQFDVLKALLDAKDKGLTKDELVNNSGHTDAVNVLKRLWKKDDDWKSIIQMAEVPGGRYRIAR
jgi:hypothetical protein